MDDTIWIAMQEFQCIFLIITSLAPTTDRIDNKTKETNLKSGHNIIIQSRRFLSDTYVHKCINTFFSPFIFYCSRSSSIRSHKRDRETQASCLWCCNSLFRKKCIGWGPDDPALKNKIGKFNTFHFVHNNHFLPRITIIISPKKFFQKKRIAGQITF